MTTQTEQRVSELFSTHIYAAPEVLFEILCELENENLKHFEPGTTRDFYEFDANKNGEAYELAVTSFDKAPPFEIMEKVSKDMDCEIHVVVYDEEYTKTVSDVTYKSGEAIEV